MVASALNIKKSDCTVISGIVKKNIVIILSLFTFAVISYDLTNESVTEETEIEFCNALTSKDGYPSRPQAVPSKGRTEEKTAAVLYSYDTELLISEVTKTIPKRPPPLCILI